MSTVGACILRRQRNVNPDICVQSEAIVPRQPIVLKSLIVIRILCGKQSPKQRLKCKRKDFFRFSSP